MLSLQRPAYGVQRPCCFRQPIPCQLRSPSEYCPAFEAFLQFTGCVQAGDIFAMQVRMRYGMDDGKEKTLEDVGQALGVSQPAGDLEEGLNRPCSSRPLARVAYWLQAVPRLGLNRQQHLWQGRCKTQPGQVDWTCGNEVWEVPVWALKHVPRADSSLGWQRAAVICKRRVSLHLVGATPCCQTHLGRVQSCGRYGPLQW